MTHPARASPELREPDLPRTVKVRPRALRTGWTTGTCASAAAKAATTALLPGHAADRGRSRCRAARRVAFAVDSCVHDPRQATAVVVKDAGDDPDVTHGAHLTATVAWRAAPAWSLDGGVGVGVVTKPGLGIDVGGPAINRGTPRAMIIAGGRRGGRPGGPRGSGGYLGARRRADGPQDHQRTARHPRRHLDPRHHRDRPAVLDRVVAGQRRAGGRRCWRRRAQRTVVLCTGGRTEKGAMALCPGLPEVCFVEVGDFTGAALRRALAGGLQRVIFVGMAGKLAKLAAGVLMTHYTRSEVDLGLLGDVTLAARRPRRWP